jgi:uncharacterized protein YbaR (Trm112 family)
MHRAESTILKIPLRADLCVSAPQRQIPSLDGAQPRFHSTLTAPRVTLGISNMAISKELLEILVCPVCKATVELKPDQSGLKCVECHRVYPVRDDIPVMLVDEAKIED